MDSVNDAPLARRPRVLVCEPIAEIGIGMLREHAEVTLDFDLTPGELLAVVAGYHALVVRSATRITAEILERGHNLLAVARAGAGLDTIDVAAARARGVRVLNSPDANTVAVAEHTMALMLSLARRLPRASLGLKEGKWEKKELMGTGLSGKTLGIVGFGRVGREVARRAQAFDMKILVNQRRPTPELKLAAAVESVDLDVLLQRSDFVSLHVPLSDETRHMIGAKQLALIKPSAYLINTARGEVVDEDALLQALDTGQIAGAALDVFTHEPATDSALARHELVIATPHIAASTVDAQQAAAQSVAEQLIELFKGFKTEEILPLRVVPLDRVVPHEHIDQKRLAKLAHRLETEGFLRNPPVVTEAGDKYVVLDGATRTAALKQLGYPHILVQVTSPEAGLELRAWHHAVSGIEVEPLVQLLSDLTDVTMMPVEVARVADLMLEYGGLCYLQTTDGRAFLVKERPGVNRLDALNQITEAYLEAADIRRTLSNDIIELQYEYRDLAAIVVFPHYTISQILHATLTSGRAFPPGITRFIIPGRVLRVNADLAMLKADKSLEEKTRWLRELLNQKLNKGGIRYYAEPVYLLDE